MTRTAIPSGSIREPESQMGILVRQRPKAMRLKRATPSPDSIGFTRTKPQTNPLHVILWREKIRMM